MNSTQKKKLHEEQEENISHEKLFSLYKMYLKVVRKIRAKEEKFFPSLNCMKMEILFLCWVCKVLLGKFLLSYFEF